MSTALSPGSTKTYAIAGLYVYPVKGCAGYSVNSVALTARGFENDRLYMIVEPDGTFLTQRQIPSLCLIRPTLTDNGILLEAPSRPQIHVPFVKDAELRSVRVWKDQCLVHYQGKDIEDWLTSFLGRPCGLIRMSEDHPRPVDQRYAKPGDIVSFADGYPFLIANEASLDELNSRLENTIPMDRFRPSIVLRGDHPWEEDNWKSLATQDMAMEIVKTCARCVVTTVDQKTAERGKEPLTTLATYRTVGDKGVIFGQNAVPRRLGTIRIDEMVQIVFTNPDGAT
jgi:uncharacterized protein